MTNLSAHDFQMERKCFYEGEDYLVRDNGAVLRKGRQGKRKRPIDNQWTFGKENSANPYLLIAGVRVHRIVATAFHGQPPNPKYVVDHIDSNCRNNRPSNLRWLTRLENALKNPATRKKIDYLCGSIEAFLENPSMLNDLRLEPSFEWMRAVTPEEAKNCMNRMTLWANTERRNDVSTSSVRRNNSFEERVFKPLQKWEAGLAGEPGLDFASTPWCAQYMWPEGDNFPCCPEDPGQDFLDDYFANLAEGAVLARGEPDDNSSELVVKKCAQLKEKAAILVLTKSADGEWALVGIELNERSHFIHFMLGRYSTRSKAEAAFSANQHHSDFWNDGYGGGRYYE